MAEDNREVLTAAPVGMFAPLKFGMFASAKVGTSGKLGERLSPDTASARSLPALTCGPICMGLLNVIWI